MPKIPQLTQTVGPRTTAAPFLQSTGDFGAGAIARGLGAAASAIATDTLRRIAKTNRAQVNEAVTLLGEAQLGLTHGFDSRPEGFVGPERPLRSAKTVNKQKGKNAAGVSMRTLEAYDDELDRLTTGLANDAQRTAFNERAAAARQQFHVQLERYENGEIEQASLDAHNANKAKGLELAIESRAGLNDFDAQAALTLEAIQSRGIEDGDEPETIQREMDDFMSKAAAGAILGNLTDKRPGNARDFFDSLKDTLSDSDGTLERVTKALELAEEEVDQTAEVRRIAALAGMVPGKRAGKDEWNLILDELRTIDDAALRGRVGAELQNEFVDINRGIDLEEDGEYDAEWRRIDDGGRYDNMDAGVKSELTNKSLDSLFALDQQRNRAAAAPAQRTNPLALAVLEDMDPHVLAKFDLRRVEHNFSTPDFKMALAKQRSARDIIAGVPDTTQISRIDALMRAELQGMEAEPDASNRRLNDARFLLNERRKAKGADLTHDEMLEVVDETLQKVWLRRSFLRRDEEVFLKDLTDEQAPNSYIPMKDITTAERSVTRKHLRLNNIDPTDEQVENAISKMLSGDNPALEADIAAEQSRRDASFQPTRDFIRERDEKLVDEIFGGFDIDITDDQKARAVRAIEDSGGADVKDEAIQKAHIMLTLNDRLKLGNEVIPEARRSAAGRALDPVTGRPSQEVPVASRQERKYWILIDMGFDDDEARSRAGLGPKFEGLLKQSFSELEGAE